VACIEFGLNLQDVLAKLGDRGVTAEAEMNIKEIAAANDIDPMGVFETLSDIVTSKSC